PTGLINAFGNKIGRKIIIKLLFVLKRIMPLCKRHRSGVEPDIQLVGTTAHRAAVRTFPRHIIVLWTVHVQLLLIGKAGIPFELINTAYHFYMIRFLVAHPYRNRRSPIALTRNSPVYIVLQPFSKAS